MLFDISIWLSLLLGFLLGYLSKIYFIGQEDANLSVIGNIIPGLIAYAVDFNNGTIYLPDSANAENNEGDGLYTIKVDGPLTKDESRRLIEEHVGGPVDWSQLQTHSMDRVNADSITASLNKVQEAR